MAEPTTLTEFKEALHQMRGRAHALSLRVAALEDREQHLRRLAGVLLGYAFTGAPRLAPDDPHEILCKNPDCIACRPIRLWGEIVREAEQLLATPPA